MVKLIALTLAITSLLKFGFLYAMVLHPFIAFWLVFVLLVPQIVSSLIWIASNALLAIPLHFAVALPVWRITLLGGFKSYALGGYQLVENYEATVYGWSSLFFLATVDLLLMFSVYILLRFLSAVFAVTD